MVSIKARILASLLNNEQAKAMELNPESELELIKIKNGVWVLTEKDAIHAMPENAKISEAEQKILSLIAAKPLNERVEEVFEKSLSKEELEKFNQLLKQGRIIKFKLNQSYKKAVYKLPEDLSKKKSTEKDLKDKQQIEEYDLEKNGFLVVKNEERARKLSELLKDRIKNGEVRGTKSFDGSFYIIESELLNALKEKAVSVLAQKKSITVPELAKEINTGIMPAKIACEFLKEDGALFEKKKELVCYIE